MGFVIAGDVELLIVQDAIRSMLASIRADWSEFLWSAEL